MRSRDSEAVPLIVSVGADRSPGRRKLRPIGPPASESEPEPEPDPAWMNAQLRETNAAMRRALARMEQVRQDSSRVVAQNRALHAEVTSLRAELSAAEAALVAHAGPDQRLAAEAEADALRDANRRLRADWLAAAESTAAERTHLRARLETALRGAEGAAAAAADAEAALASPDGAEAARLGLQTVLAALGDLRADLADLATSPGPGPVPDADPDELRSLMRRHAQLEEEHEANLALLSRALDDSLRIDADSLSRASAPVRAMLELVAQLRSEGAVAGRIQAAAVDARDEAQRLGTAHRAALDLNRRLRVDLERLASEHRRLLAARAEDGSEVRQLENELTRWRQRVASLERWLDDIYVAIDVNRLFGHRRVPPVQKPRVPGPYAEQHLKRRARR